MTADSPPSLLLPILNPLLDTKVESICEILIYNDELIFIKHVSVVALKTS